MVHVVFAKVVLGQVRYVRLLDVRDIGELEYADIHGGGVDDRISDGVKCIAIILSFGGSNAR